MNKHIPFIQASMVLRYNEPTHILLRTTRGVDTDYTVVGIKSNSFNVLVNNIKIVVHNIRVSQNDHNLFFSISPGVYHFLCELKAKEKVVDSFQPNIKDELLEMYDLYGDIKPFAVEPIAVEPDISSKYPTSPEPFKQSITVQLSINNTFLVTFHKDEDTDIVNKGYLRLSHADSYIEICIKVDKVCKEFNFSGKIVFNGKIKDVFDFSNFRRRRPGGKLKKYTSTSLIDYYENDEVSKEEEFELNIVDPYEEWNGKYPE